MAAHGKLLLLSALHFHSLYTRLAFPCSCPFELPSHSCHLAALTAAAPQNQPRTHSPSLTTNPSQSAEKTFRALPIRVRRKKTVSIR